MTIDYNITVDCTYLLPAYQTNHVPQVSKRVELNMEVLEMNEEGEYVPVEVLRENNRQRYIYINKTSKYLLSAPISKEGAAKETLNLTPNPL